MPVYRMSKEHHERLRSLPGLHWVGDTQRQHDGSFIIHGSIHKAKMIGMCEIELDSVAERIEFPHTSPEEMKRAAQLGELCRQHGNWSVYACNQRYPKATPQEIDAMLVDGIDLASARTEIL